MTWEMFFYGNYVLHIFYSDIGDGLVISDFLWQNGVMMVPWVPYGLEMCYSGVVCTSGVTSCADFVVGVFLAVVL